MTQALQWIALSLVAGSLAASGLAALLSVAAWRRFKARNRRAIRVFVASEVVRQVGPISARLANHDLELELLKAFHAEARRYATPALRIAETPDGPDLAA